MVKRLIALCLLTGMLFSLCSCTRLSALKERYAYFYEDGNETKISYKDKSYRLVDLEEIRPNYPEYHATKKVNVAKDENVPLLLSERIGSTFFASEGGEILWGYEKYYSQITSAYVREDYIEEIENAVSLKSEYYCRHDDRWVLISKELDAAVKEIMATVTPETYNKEKDWVHTVGGISRCDENVAIVAQDGGYALFKHQGAYGICPDEQNDSQTGLVSFYRIPDKYVELFKSELEPIL